MDFQTCRAAQFGEIYERMSGLFFESRTVLCRAGAFLLTAEGCQIGDGELNQAAMYAERLLERDKIILPEAKPLLTAFLLMDGNPERFRAAIHRGMRALKRKFYPSSQLIWSAALLALLEKDTTAYDMLARTSRSLYKEMEVLQKSCSPWRDIPICTLYALRGESDIQVRMTRCADALQQGFRLHSSVRAPAQVLALYPDGEERCRQVLCLQQTLAGQGLHPGRGMVLTALAVIAGLDLPAETAAHQIAQTVQRLGQFPGLSLWGISRKERLLWAIMLSALEETSSLTRRDVLLASVIIIVSAYGTVALEGTE